MTKNGGCCDSNVPLKIKISSVYSAFFFKFKKKNQNQNTLLISRKKFDEKMEDAVAVAMTQMFFIIKLTDDVNIK